MNKLAEQLSIAFSSSEYPGDNEIVYDNSGEHLECNDVRADFQGKKWDEVLFDTLVVNKWSLSFFSDKGYRYYLPSYILACLTDLKRADVIPHNIISSLTPSSGELTQVEFEKRMDKFTESQKKTIKDFLEYLDNNLKNPYPDYPPQKALDEYWEQF